MIFLSLFFAFSISASDQNLVDYFQVLPGDILNVITCRYIAGYDGRVPMSVSTINRSFYEHTKGTIQDRIKHKVLFDISKLLYDTPLNTFIEINCGGLLKKKKANLAERNLRDDVREAAEKCYTAFFQLLDNFINQKRSFLQETVMTTAVTNHLILYDGEQELYEYWCGCPEQIDETIASGNKTIIKLVTPLTKFDQYYKKLYDNKSQVIHRIYTETCTGEKFLQDLVERISVPVQKDCKGEQNKFAQLTYDIQRLREKNALIQLACNILEYDITSGHNIVVSYFLNNLDRCCEIHHESMILEEMVKRGSYRAVKALLFCGMDPNKHGPSALCHAILEDNIDIVNLLTRYGAKPNLLNRDDDSPLYLAALHGRQDIVKALLQAGAYPDGVEGQNGSSPLHISVHYKYFGITQLLIQKGAKVNNQRPGGSTVLHDVAQSPERYEFAQLLLKHGADPLIPDNVLRTPLSVARTNGVTETVKLFEDHLKKQEETV